MHRLLVTVVVQTDFIDFSLHVKRCHEGDRLSRRFPPVQKNIIFNACMCVCVRIRVLTASASCSRRVCICIVITSAASCIRQNYFFTSLSKPRLMNLLYNRFAQNEYIIIISI